MSTYIHGIGASENIDSSGERIIVAGLDISSLAVDGVFNYEHEQGKDAQGNAITVKLPSMVVGKVLKAKKIFSEKDCEDEHETYFWQKCQVPFVYVMGELFDDYKESAKDVAGMFRYDQDRKGQQERNVMNFSIEGGKIEKQGIDVTKSVGRKVTITVLPCNKAAEAEIIAAPGSQPKNDMDSLFKTEGPVEIELFKAEDVAKFMKKMNKAEIPADPRGKHIGTTTSGKHIYSHEKIPNYQGFNSKDHKEAANFHHNMLKPTHDGKHNQHHMGKMSLHLQASRTHEKREQRYSHSSFDAAKAKMATPKFEKQKLSSVQRPYGQVDDIKKAMTAGSGNAAPGNLTGGAALASQDLDKKLKKTADLATHQATLNHANPMRGATTNRAKQSKATSPMATTQLAKNEWLVRAEAEFKNWDQKENFIKFMSDRMPTMTKSEIEVFGSVMILKKSMEQEQALNKALKFDFQPSGSKQDGTPAKVPDHVKGHNKAPKGIEHTEVEHVHPHYDGKSADTVYTKAGHKLEGHEKGKFKAGDKVTVKSHMMGTHILEHGHKD